MCSRRYAWYAAVSLSGDTGRSVPRHGSLPDRGPTEEECTMAWYDDKQSVLHIARYKNAHAAWKEGNEAAKLGWTVKETTEAPPTVAVGRAIRNGILIGLLKG